MAPPPQVAQLLQHPMIADFLQAHDGPAVIDLAWALDTLRELGQVELTSATRTVERGWRCELSLHAVYTDLSGEDDDALVAALRCLMEALYFMQRAERELHSELRDLLDDA